MTDNTVKFGLVEWDAPDTFVPRGDRNRERNDWVNLRNGDNKVRLLTGCYQYINHKYKEQVDPKFGINIKCAKVSKDDPCPICDLGSKVQSRYYAWVIDRTTQTEKILDMPSTVFQGIKTLANSEWGPPDSYDINIIKNSNLPAAQMYKVINLPPKPLSPEDSDKKSKINKETLMNLSKPFTVEQATKKLEAYREKLGITSKSQASTEEMSSESNSDDDEQYVFPQA